MGALHKAWKRYVIAKEKGEDDKMELYAHRIQEPQQDLGLPISSFDDIGMSAASFLWELAHKDDDNQEQQVAEEGNYLGYRQYEEERFTMHIANISKMMRIKRIGSLITIVKISQIDILALEPTRV